MDRERGLGSLEVVWCQCWELCRKCLSVSLRKCFSYLHAHFSKSIVLQWNGKPQTALWLSSLQLPKVDEIWTLRALDVLLGLRPEVSADPFGVPVEFLGPTGSARPPPSSNAGPPPSPVRSPCDSQHFMFTVTTGGLLETMETNVVFSIFSWNLCVSNLKVGIISGPLSISKMHAHLSIQITQGCGFLPWDSESWSGVMS